MSNPELEQLLLRQRGVATASQLMTCVTRRELAFHLRTGRLQKAWHGIYTRPDPSRLDLLHALDVATGASVAACLGTAAALHGFDTENTRGLHIVNPRGHQIRAADGLFVHRRDGAPLIMLDGRPVTAPAWTAIEVARGLRRPRALATLDAALRSGTCTRDGLTTAAVRQAGRRGIVAVRDLIPVANALAESPMESEARLVMIDGGLPTPVLQYEIVDPRFRTWRVDFAWPDRRVVAEYDSEDWHGTVRAMRRDRTRYNALRDIGWVVVPIVADDVRRYSWELVTRLARELDRSATG